MIATWCARNEKTFNVSKCLSLSFTRARQPHAYVYAINGVPIKVLTTTKDLGVIFDRTLSFTPHYLEIIRKASLLFGYVKHIAKDFDDLFALKTEEQIVARDNVGDLLVD